jgi:hypothetical protein
LMFQLSGLFVSVLDRARRSGSRHLRVRNIGERSTVM